MAIKKGKRSVNRKPIQDEKGEEKKMTENAIRYKQYREDMRHNKEEERRKEKERKADVYSKAGSAAGSAIGALIGAQDPIWYKGNPNLVKDTASLSYNNPLGAPLSDIGMKDSVPGVMVIEFQPVLGDDRAANSAAKNIYAYVRFANSGSKNYEPNDLISYILQMGDIYSFHGFMTKVYSLLRDMKSQNYYYYKTMLRALHIDADDLRAHIADFRALINSFATRANALSVPSGIPLFARRYWMHTVIAKDSQIKKSQEYMFNQSHYYFYDDTNSKLEPVSLYDINDPTDLLTYSEIRTYAENLLDTVLSSSDIGIMSGDILKAYGEGKMHRLAMIDESFHIESVYNPEILSQIENITILGPVRAASTASSGGSSISAEAMFKNIYTIWCPAGGELKQGVAITALGSNQRQYLITSNWAENESYTNRIDYGSDLALVMYKDDPTPDDNMVASRLAAHVNSPESGLVAYCRNNDGTFSAAYYNSSVNSALGFRLVDAHGTEVILTANIYQYNADSGIEDVILYYQTPFGVSTASDLSTITKLWGAIAKFEFAPMSIAINKSTHVVLGNTKEYKNYASVSVQVLNNMNYTAVLSLYGVPLIGGVK